MSTENKQSSESKETPENTQNSKETPENTQNSQETPENTQSSKETPENTQSSKPRESSGSRDTIFIGKKPLMAYVTSTLIQLAN